MRTSEFEGAMEELGFTIEIDSYDEIYVNNSCGTVASAPKNKIYNIDTDWDDFENLGETGQSELFFTLTEYASTPISEREEEKLYWLKLINKTVDESVSYLSKIKEKERYFVSSNIHFVDGTQTIFTESELKHIDETGFERKEVEQ